MNNPKTKRIVIVGGARNINVNNLLSELAEQSQYKVVNSPKEGLPPEYSISLATKRQHHLMDKTQVYSVYLGEKKNLPPGIDRHIERALLMVESLIAETIITAAKIPKAPQKTAFAKRMRLVIADD
jgi:hypothetical protein